MSGLRITLLGEVDELIEPDGRPEAGSGRPVEVRPLPPTDADRVRGARRLEVTVDGWVLRYLVEDEDRATLIDRATRGRAADVAHVREIVRARIPGRVTRTWVEPGQHVVAGQRLLAVEAMKMENEVRAHRSGVVTAIAVQPGQAVELNAELLTLD